MNLQEKPIQNRGRRIPQENGIQDPLRIGTEIPDQNRSNSDQHAVHPFPPLRGRTRQRIGGHKECPEQQPPGKQVPFRRAIPRLDSPRARSPEERRRAQDRDDRSPVGHPCDHQNKPPNKTISPEVSPELPGLLPSTMCEVSSKCPSFACIRGVAVVMASGVVEVAYCNRRPVNPLPASVQQVPIHKGKANARINRPAIAG